MKIETKAVMVTPEMAKKWLKFNVQNRNIRDRHVENLADDMAHGRWEDTHQGIAFYDDGTLADGQHRLEAIVKSGKTIKFLVTNNLSKNSSLVIDQTVKRMAHDAIRISGEAPWMDKDMVALVKFMMSNMGSDPYPRNVSEIVSYAQRYSEHLVNAASYIRNKKRYFTSAPIAAAYLCALVAGEPKEKIKRFGEIMYSGEISGPHETAAIRLREFLISNPNAWVGMSRQDSSKRIQRAIYAFCRGQHLHILRQPADFTYPIPT